MEALERARAAYGTGSYDDATIEYLFPEVKESEDERMLKKIIEYLEMIKMGCVICTIDTSEEIAWLEKQKEQKPAEWSEEDENMLWNIISIVGESKSIQADEMLDWLKSLRPQPKQEWSVKDELTFTNSVETLEYLGKFELADWLKEHKNQFLKPQNTWKPSEEQLSQLQFALNLLEEKCGSVPNVLWNLCDELKKL